VAERTEDAILIEEIDNELRQDQANKLWRNYGKYVITSCIAIVISVGIYQSWNSYDLKTRQDSGERFAAAITLAADDKIDASFDAFSKIIIDGTDGYRTLARFSHARLMAQKNDSYGAVIAYNAIAEDTSVDPLYRDLAVILSALIEINIPDANKKVIKQKLSKLIEKNNSLRFSAMEISAFIDQKAGLNSEALKLLKNLENDKLAPKGVRARANELLSIISK
jgi:hypothetical protein